MIDINRLPSFEIQDADRTQSFLRLAFCGPSGAGKTATLLRVAGGMLDYMLEHNHCPPGRDRKIGIVDTERKSARLYQEKMFPDGKRVPPFKVIDLGAPYTIDRYLGALMSFYRAGFPIIGIDQISHAWAGSGGLLEQKTELAKKEHLNDFTAFAEITPMQNAFIEQILSLDAHVICTMRSHQKYVLENYTKNGQTKSRPKRVGMAPVQREGVEYEFTVVLDLDIDGNSATVNKDRTDVFGVSGTVIGCLTEEHGRKLAQWLYTGRSVDASGTDRGTPQQRLDAVVATYVAGFDKAVTLPDLAADFERAWVAVRDFDIGDYAKINARKALTASKDVNKARVSPRPPAGDDLGIPLDHLEATMIEDNLKAHEIPLDEFAREFGVVRIGQLSAERVNEAQAWILANSKRAAA